MGGSGIFNPIYSDLWGRPTRTTYLFCVCYNNSDAEMGTNKQGLSKIAQLHEHINLIWSFLEMNSIIVDYIWHSYSVQMKPNIFSISKWRYMNDASQKLLTSLKICLLYEQQQKMFKKKLLVIFTNNCVHLYQLVVHYRKFAEERRKLRVFITFLFISVFPIRNKMKMRKS